MLKMIFFFLFFCPILRVLRYFNVKVIGTRIIANGTHNSEKTITTTWCIGKQNRREYSKENLFILKFSVFLPKTD